MASTTVNFNLKSADNANFAGQTLVFNLLNAGAIGSSDFVVLPSTVTATSDSNGDGSVTLFRNGDSEIESVYEVVFPNRERSQFIIPTGTSTVELSSLIVNNVPTGATSQQSSVFNSAIQRANHTGTQALSTISDSATVQLKPSEGAFVDGDKTKLDAIEASADVTDATNVTAAGALMDSELSGITHVKALNQSVISGASPTFVTTNMTDSSDKRFMTDAQETKLDSVESSADVTDTANVTAAGALMDSEVTNLAAVKSFSASDYATASQGTLATNALPKSGGAMTGAITTNSTFDGRDVATDGTKLDGIEASADVTDATNVQAAGALMDSELADVTGIKTLTLPDSTTISTFAKTFLDDADALAVKSTLGVSSFVPRSITFTDTSAFLSLADNSALDVDTGDFTLSFSARLDSSGTEPVLTKLSGTGYRLRFVSGSLILTMQDSSGSADFTLATSLNDNKWHTYVVTVDRNANAIAYVDNVAQTGVSVSGTAGTLANSGLFQIGSDGGSNAADGIALGNYVSLHKSALTSSQAGQIYFSADAALTAVAPTLMVDLRKADKTFTDISTNALAVTTNGTIIFNEGRITSLDNATIGATTAAAGTFTSISASDGNITNVGDINCDSISADDAATGLNVIFDGTDTGDNKITLTDNLASALDITESSNSYLKFTTTNSGEKVVLGKDLDISGDHDLIIGTSTGTKIGTATNQKIGFFNATPVIQQSGTGETTGFTASSGTAVNDDSTFTGNVGSTAYRINDVVKALKNLGILAQ